MGNANTVLETIVGSTRKHIVCNTELFEISQALELRGIDDLDDA
jgi:hypothetical protein